jgi:hypothetical protein
MSRRPSIAGLVAAAACFAGHAVPAHAAEPQQPQKEDSKVSSFRLAGYAKALALRSKTTDGARQSYGLGLGRVRLKMTYVHPRVEAHVEQDTELRTGSHLETAEFRRQKDMPPGQYVAAQSNFVDTRRLYGTARFFRAHVKLKTDSADLTVGRQRIPLGTGRLWSALDLLNPANPLQVERNEYVGVDAALLEYRLSDTSKAMLVFAPDPAKRHARWNLRYQTHLQNADVTLTYGKYWEDRLVGVDVSTQLGDAGLRGEFSLTRPAVGPSYRKVLLGVDYGFANTLVLSAEYFHSSQSEQDRLAAFQRNSQLAQVQPSGSRYLGFAASYDITPLVKFNGYWLTNLTDGSRFFSPSISYSVTEDLNVTGGAQFFLGNTRSDYGRGENLYFLQLQRFF